MTDCFKHGTERELRCSGMLHSLARSKGCVTAQKRTDFIYPLLQPEITRSVAAAGFVQLEGLVVCMELVS